MSCCPSVKCRNTGSGYVKPSASGSSAECSKKLDELMAARAAQDHTYFPPPIHSTPEQINVCSTGTSSIPPPIPTPKKK